ncbi:hypothetical protein DQ384_31105 [Sphaerisporangium album]|uniref:Uncharacterized protein n=1 Tax=Sphaerisporangium album TaxID=509200 RepID=A0A367F4M0_9ACTN|nr:hypothetical protein DQ384_31105 [Sphaerisporangium album]
MEVLMGWKELARRDFSLGGLCLLGVVCFAVRLVLSQVLDYPVGVGEYVIYGVLWVPLALSWVWMRFIKRAGRGRGERIE